ncbi:MAG: magnesium transporter [Pseudomonadota bacterium]
MSEQTPNGKTTSETPRQQADGASDPAAETVDGPDSVATAREEPRTGDETSNEEAQQPAFVARVEEALEEADSGEVRALVDDLHEADLADLIEVLAPEDRSALVATLGSDLNFDVLPELDEAVRDQVIDEMPNAQIAEAVQQLDSDDAVYLLEDLDAAEQSDILAQVPASDRAQILKSLEYPEDSAGRLMQTEFIAVPPFWSVGQTIDYMRETDDLPEDFSAVFVVDPTFHILGSVALDRLLRAKRPVLIESLMSSEPRQLTVDDDQEDVARQFERYDLRTAPVVDANDRLVGVVTHDDVIEVIQEEADEDIKRLGGVGEESLADSVIRVTQNRFLWLLINLGTAIVASIIIGLFDATIQEMVALAVLMPIVASMGGNAATQTMTVAVRSLSTRDLSLVNARRIITREALVGLFNGMIFAIIVGLVAIVWFGNGSLAVVIAVAMIVNMLSAGLAGILIPIALQRAGADPAIASSVFVTTVTDVVGFFAFLGLAAVWLI